MPAQAKAGPADPACSARPPRRTAPTKSPPTAPVSRSSVPRDGPCRREQRTRSQTATNPGHHRQRPFPIDTSKPPAASSLGGFPTRADVTPDEAARRGPHRKTFTKAAGLIVQLLLYHPPQSRRSSGAPRNEAKMVEMGTNGRLQCGGVIPAEILLGIQG